MVMCLHIPYNVCLPFRKLYCSYLLNHRAMFDMAILEP